MSDSSSFQHDVNDNRREKRFTISEEAQIPVRVQRSSDDQDQFVGGVLSDLSPCGAKLLLPDCLQIAENVSVRIVIEELQIVIDVSGEICWSRPAEDGRWHAGFSFTPRIDAELLNHLASTGFIDRREHTRRIVDGTIQVYRELDAEPFESELTDYALGGFCMQTPTACRPGQRLRLCVPGEDGEQILVAGKVRWNMNLNERNIVGCLMNTPAQFELLHQFAKNHVVEEKSPPSDQNITQRSSNGSLSRGARVALFASCAAVIGISLGLFHILEFGEPADFTTAQVSPSSPQRAPATIENPGSVENPIEPAPLTHEASEPQFATPPMSRPPRPQFASPPAHHQSPTTTRANAINSPTPLQPPTTKFRTKSIDSAPLPDQPASPAPAPHVTDRQGDSSNYAFRTRSIRSPSRRSSVKVTELVFPD